MERFVLVSTDKAVSPATVMGASKALAEWAVEAAQNRWKGTRYASVRFGNVLGSSGSVVPIFRRQIAKGGPVTVTDSRMTRYFMTIPEAVQLIIRSGELATGGEVFVLEMGDPVKIVDLAANMIRLAGYEPDVDIAIEIVGRRPGEKIHEELFNPGERPQPTPAEKIVCAVQPPLEPEWVESAFARIEALVYGGDAAGAGRLGDRAVRRARAAAGSDVGARTPLRSTVRPLPEIVQEIGAYAGLASVVGLAVLSALYFSQARDVKRLREWAGRAPERSEQGAPAVPGRVVAQPQQPAAATPPAAAPPPVPGKPATPGTPGSPRAGHAGRPGSAGGSGGSGRRGGDRAAEQANGRTCARRAERERGSGGGAERSGGQRGGSRIASERGRSGRGQAGRPHSGRSQA